VITNSPIRLRLEIRNHIFKIRLSQCNAHKNHISSHIIKKKKSFPNHSLKTLLIPLLPLKDPHKDSHIGGFNETRMASYLT